MKTKVIYGIVGTLLLISIGVYFFFHRTYLDFELVAEIQNPKEEFYPLAYEFFHLSEKYARFFDRNIETREMKSGFPSPADLDFEKYTYCICFGKQVKDMFYSHKTTCFNDPSPSYASARHYGKKFVVVSYQEAAPMEENGVFLYRVPKDDKLRGVDGL